MRRIAKLRTILLLLAMAPWCAAHVLSVPGDYPTIQEAVDATENGDVVLVAPGTYTGDGSRDIDFGGKAITVKSEAGPETCIIDCQGSPNEPHRGFYFHSCEDANSIVQGFTITGGFAVGDDSITAAGGGASLKADPNHCMDDAGKEMDGDRETPNEDERTWSY